VTLSSNLAFSGWESIFNDAIMTAAIDRLPHGAGQEGPADDDHGVIKISRWDREK
jgi:hypothetical protein